MASPTSLRTRRRASPEKNISRGDPGRDVLIVYDDLTTTRARLPRISLLLRRTRPARGVPGDIFYIHSPPRAGDAPLRRARRRIAHRAADHRTEAQRTSRPTSRPTDLDHRWADLHSLRRCSRLGVLPPSTWVNRLLPRRRQSARRGAAATTRSRAISSWPYAQFKKQGVRPVRRAPGRGHANEHRARAADSSVPESSQVLADLSVPNRLPSTGIDSGALRQVHRSIG
jgi:hypothetical protein